MTSVSRYGDVVAAPENQNYADIMKTRGSLEKGAQYRSRLKPARLFEWVVLPVQSLSPRNVGSACKSLLRIRRSLYWDCYMQDGVCIAQCCSME